jgi:hypothetical protein
VGLKTRNVCYEEVKKVSSVTIRDVTNLKIYPYR